MSEQDLNIGDPAYGSFGKYGRINVKRGTVVKITPTGQVVVDFGEKYPGNGKPFTRRFKSGHEIGGAWDSGGLLIPRDRYERLSIEQEVRDHLTRALEACRTAHFSKPEDLDAIISKLNGIKASLPLNGGGSV
jgi:hypothetical protein